MLLQAYMRYNSKSLDANAPLNQIGAGLSQFTMCMWLSINFLRGRRTTFVSYSSEAAVSSFYGGTYDMVNLATRGCNGLWCADF
jgi:hypothetical protein